MSEEHEHGKVDLAGPGDDVALAVVGHVHENDLIFREARALRGSTEERVRTRGTLFAAVFVALIAGSCASSGATPWPTQAWRTATPASQGMDEKVLAQMFSAIDAEIPTINSVVVVRNGYMVAEKYYGRWDARSKHTVQSVTKSVVSALMGIALAQGCIKSLDDPIWNYLPGRTSADKDPRKQKITLKHLLTMSSGIAWTDSLSANWDSSDWVQYVLDQPMAAEPGTVWNYNSAGLNLVSAILQNACGGSTLEFAKRYLFAPLGMGDVQWDTDPKGIPNGGWGISMTPRDMAKFGLLYLNGGVWNGQQIVPAEWVKASTQKYFKVPTAVEPWDLYYGYSWWMDGDGPYYGAHGRGGQFIYVLPEQQTVVVFTSDLNTPDADFVKLEQLIRDYIVPAAK